MKRVWIFSAVAALAGSSLCLAQDQREDAVVSELVVTAPEEARVPKVGVGAPQFTASEITAIQEQARRTVSEATNAVNKCFRQALNLIRPTTIRGMLGQAFAEEREAALKVQALSVEARKATEAAQAVRREVLTGRPSASSVIDTELARQKAVNALVAARNDLDDASAAIPVLQKLITQLDSPLPNERGWERNSVDKILPQVMTFKAMRASRRLRPTPVVFADLAIRDVVVRESEDGKGAFLAVSGKVLNKRSRAAPVPSLEITQLDGFGFALETVIADPARRQIAPGEAVSFGYEFRPKANRAERVQVTFSAAEPLPPRRSATAPIAPPQPMGRGGGGSGGQLAGGMGQRAGDGSDGPSDCSG